VNPGTLAAVTVLGGACGLDRTAFGQTLLAHPMIAATLAGALAGDVGAGVYAGIALTSVSAPVLPVGERSLRDWTSAAVVLGAMAGHLHGAAERGAALLAVLLVARFGGTAIHAVRARAAALLSARRMRPGVEQLEGIEVEHLGLASLHLVRGALLTGACVALGSELLPRGVGSLGEPERLALARLWMVAPLAGLPLLLRFHSGPGRLWPHVGAGLILGLAVCVALVVLWPDRLADLHGVGAP
jgi:hypothetical protein